MGGARLSLELVKRACHSCLPVVPGLINTHATCPGMRGLGCHACQHSLTSSMHFSRSKSTPFLKHPRLATSVHFRSLQTLLSLCQSLRTTCPRSPPLLRGGQRLNLECWWLVSTCSAKENYYYGLGGEGKQLRSSGLGNETFSHEKESRLLPDGGLIIQFRKASGTITPRTQRTHFFRQLLFLSFRSIISSGIRPRMPDVCIRSSSFFFNRVSVVQVVHAHTHVHTHIFPLEWSPPLTQPCSCCRQTR